MDAIAKEEKTLEVVKFNVNDAQIAAVVAKYADIEIIPDDAVTYKTVMKGLSEHRNIRIDIEAKKKELTKDAMRYVCEVRDEAKRLQELNEPGEQYLKAIRATEDDRVDKIEKDRVDGIKEKILSIERLDYSLSSKSAEELEALHILLQNTRITEEEYGEFVGDAMATLHNTSITIKESWDYRVKQDKEAEARKAEETRLAVIRKEQAAEATRLAKIAAEQATEQKRKEALNVLFEAQKDWFKKHIKGDSFQTPDVDTVDTAIIKLQSAIDTTGHEPAMSLLLDEQIIEARGILIFRKQQANIDQEQEALAKERKEIKEKQDAFDTKLKKEQERRDREALEEKMAREAKERAEAEVRKAIVRKGEEEARQKALKTDKEKLYALVNDLNDIGLPTVQAKEAGAILLWLSEELDGLSKILRQRTDDL